jgi:cellulose synthase operon protein C
MDALVFPSEEALIAALRFKLVPEEVQQKAASYGLRKNGAVEVVPVSKLSSAQLKVLKSSGVEVAPVSGPLVSRARWLEIPQLQQVEIDSAPEVLFGLRTQRHLLEFCGELLRLGCQAQEIQMVSSDDSPFEALLKVQHPPWYAVARALENDSGLTAFRALAQARDSIFVQLGFRHQCEAQVQATPQTLQLIHGAGHWSTLAQKAWTPLGELLQPEDLLPVQKTEGRQPPLFRVPLRLQRARTEPARMYLVEAGLIEVERLVNSMPEAQLADILFAVVGECVVLRPRPGRESAADAWPGAAYSRVSEIPNLFAPQGWALEPPIRRERLKKWLAGNSDEVVWLQQTETGLARFALDESAFRSLSEWVDYVVDASAPVLTAWMRSATFDFEGFVATDEFIATPATTAQVEENEHHNRKSQPAPSRRTENKSSSKESSAEPQTAPFAVPQVRGRGDEESLIAREELAFSNLNAPADSSERRLGWLRLAEMYAQVKRPHDSGMAFAHALWIADEPHSKTLAIRWNEVGQFRPEQLGDAKFLTAERGRAAVAAVTAASLGHDAQAVAKPAEWIRYFDAVGQELDVRSLWLARFALAKISGGDKLALARARDKILTRLTNGLNLERDVPRLMRTTGPGSQVGASDRVERVAAQLESVLKAMDETPRKRTAVEAPQALTRPYLQLVFAWGFARLGRVERSRQLREVAIASLDAKEPVHQFLGRAYSARIQQALDGASPMTALGPDLQLMLQSLDASLRYKVDRLRQFSTILEPQERMDPINSFLRNLQVRGEELSALKSMGEPDVLRQAIEARMSTAANHNLAEEERVRLMDGLIDFLPQLPESQAVPLLQQFLQLCTGLTPAHRALVLEDCLKVAGHFGRAPLVKQIVKSLLLVMSELGAEGVAEIGVMLTSGVRSLRRVGLREEAEELLAKANGILKGDDVKTLQAKLGLASGFAYLGALGQAQPIIDEVIARLSRESGLIVSDRMRLNRACALALSHAPTEIALAGLLRMLAQLPFATDSFNTNSHFCLALVDLADALVMGHVGEDLTLSDATRRFLDEDEFAVRKRIHRDVGALT